MQRYTIHLREDWPVERAKAAFDKQKHVITLQPATVVPLVFKRREVANKFAWTMDYKDTEALRRGMDMTTPFG